MIRSSVQSSTHTAAGHTAAGEWNDALAELACRVDALGHGADLLVEARSLFQGLKRAEARHVQGALSNPGFPFAAAQERLGTLRATFAVRARAEAHSLALRERRQLLDLAYLCKHSPLTDVLDLDAIREARASRRFAPLAS